MLPPRATRCRVEGFDAVNVRNAAMPVPADRDRRRVSSCTSQLTTGGDLADDISGDIAKDI